MGYLMFKKFIRDENGATAIEYGLIAALIALVIIAGAQLAGENLLAKFNLIASKLV
jgi:pilus assembly protein Flp/PilA